MAWKQKWGGGRRQGAVAEKTFWSETVRFVHPDWWQDTKPVIASVSPPVNRNDSSTDISRRF